MHFILTQVINDSLKRTINEIDSVIEVDSHWSCDLHFNETENNKEPPKYVNFSDVMESNEHYNFPSHFNGLNNMNKIVLALRVMCIKAGFYFVHRSTKIKKQLTTDHNAYITLCCQHSLMYCTAKIGYIRSTLTKLCTNSDKRCCFSINIALCKHSDKWFLKK